MGRFWASSIIFLSVICFLIFDVNKITNITDTTLGSLNLCLMQIYQDNLLEAYSHFETAKNNFKENEKYLCATLTHRELDEIIVQFSMAEASLYMSDKESLLPMLNSLTSRLEHIKDMEDISIKNIF